ncbi:uncharacterized protein [Pyxicephalus adspersus]|uniref:uncharacterized protein n=1 Tax=Pyxicephalus adspersus TaxID=30357 RepID=UPI003B5A7A84
MEIVNLMDLSFLTKKEQGIIQHVLKRDTDLRKREERRVRKIRRQGMDRKCLKLQTGEWFEEMKAKRFVKYSSATDLLKCVLENNQPGSLSFKRISWLSKIKSLKTFTSPPNPYDLPERCHQMGEKNILVRDEYATVPNEQLSVTQILKEFEIMLDLEIQNLNSTVEIADINGSSPENVLVDKTLSAVYSSHQVWHYPDLMDMNAVQANLSPVTTIITASEKDLLTSKYCFLPEEDVQNANHNYIQIPHITDPAFSIVCSGHLETPLFCSSPYLPEQDSENFFKFDCSESNSNYFTGHGDQPSTETELSSDQSLDSESTLEPTIIAENSQVLIEHMVSKEDVPRS